jgi:hypothetical protein
MLGLALVSPQQARARISRYVEQVSPTQPGALPAAGKDNDRLANPSMLARIGRYVGERVTGVPRRLLRPWRFTNACGDCTLLAREDWDRLGGYPEWPVFSWHLDSILLYQAEGVGLREESFGPQAPVYHIEHGKGSGYTPEGADALFSSLVRRGIPFLSDAELRQVHLRIRSQARSEPGPLFNGPAWGMANKELPDHALRQATRI